MTTLSDLAQITADLRAYHDPMDHCGAFMTIQKCPGPANCQLAKAIADLGEVMDGIAKEMGRPRKLLGEWRDISELDRNKMQLILIHGDGAVRVLLWHPAGHWENPEPFGSRYYGPEPTEWMELPPSPAGKDLA